MNSTGDEGRDGIRDESQTAVLTAGIAVVRRDRERAAGAATGMPRSQRLVAEADGTRPAPEELPALTRPRPGAAKAPC